MTGRARRRGALFGGAWSVARATEGEIEGEKIGSRRLTVGYAGEHGGAELRWCGRW
jgi:hypothetical protein